MISEDCTGHNPTLLADMLEIFLTCINLFFIISLLFSLKARFEGLTGHVQ